MSVDRIDRDWATHFANEPAPPHGVGPTSLRGCIAPSATIRLVRSIKHDGRQCTIGDGIWLSRPAVDGDRAFVAVVENDCATDGWLVALERMPDGRWRAAAPRLLWFSLLEPRRD
jgi:hypothetical protein